ncbi:MAG TPA: hypothetical protein PL131_06975 [Methylotenera sp.]|nr:hypothetical protein [Methylotenera sp.]HPH05602.1 hypothetical protein [Methylotenera sp.]HPM99983.1 hypothetical protein [Methylotenera sp.]
MLIIFIVINIILLVMMFLARSALQSFLSKHQAMNSAEAMADFKLVARMNMYGALVYLVGGLAVLAMGVMLVIKMGIIGMLVAILFSLPSLFLSLNVKKLEENSKSLPWEQSLNDEYEHVKEVWVKKALPDF